MATTAEVVRAGKRWRVADATRGGSRVDKGGSGREREKETEKNSNSILGKFLNNPLKQLQR